MGAEGSFRAFTKAIQLAGMIRTGVRRKDDSQMTDNLEKTTTAMLKDNESNNYC